MPGRPKRLAGRKFERGPLFGKERYHERGKQSDRDRSTQWDLDSRLVEIY